MILANSLRLQVDLVDLFNILNIELNFQKTNYNTKQRQEDSKQPSCFIIFRYYYSSIIYEIGNFPHFQTN